MGATLVRRGIAAKLALMAGPALLGLAILFAVAYWGFSNQKRSIDDLYLQRFANFKESAFLQSECTKVHANLYKTLAWANAGFDGKQIEALTSEQMQRLAALERRAADQVNSTALGQTEREMFKQAGDLLKAYAKAAADVIDVATADTGYAAILMATADERYTALGKVLVDLATLEESLGKESYASARESYGTGLTAFVVVGLGALIISVLMIYVGARRLIRQIATAQSTVAMIAAGDLTRGVSSDERDEIGDMLRSVERMRVSLAGMISAVNAVALELHRRSETLLGAANTGGNSASAQSSAAQSSAAAIQELNVGLASVGETATEVKRFADDAGNRSREGSGIISQVAAEMETISRRVAASSEAVLALAKSAGSIEDIVGVIKGLAEQTNLLALNAAIEAARAGESGRGFAVVADEVRKLAEGTQSSTEQIAAVVAGIQAHSASATQAMATVATQVGDGLKLAEDARAAIATISASATELVAQVDDIALSLQEQNSAATDIARNVEQMARGAEETANQAEGLSKEAMGMKTLSDSLSNAVGRFRL
jgi:methyl-accepting chemotaxis protein